MARSKGKWVRRSEGEWRSLLLRFEHSGLGVEAFCRRYGVSAASFYRWRSLLGIESEGPDDAPVEPGSAFVDLGTLSSARSAGACLDLKLDLGGGLILHLVRT